MHVPSEDPDLSDRLVRVQRLIDDCIDRSIAGEAVSHEAIIEAHADLMPELGEELRNLAAIERARRRFAGSSNIQGFSESCSAKPSPSLRSGPPDFFPGYEILNEIHRGGQGVVYRAIQESTKREVAIKVLREWALAGPRELARFEREVQILASLKHPNIVAVHESGTAAAGNFYFVMDHISGQPLDRYMRERHRVAPGISINDTLALFAGICDAVNAAHLRGIIHRDLKPANVRVDADGNPHVLDFGLAKMTAGESDPASDECEASALTITGQFMGSLPWASPEQARGLSDLDLRTDVYSLGVILFQMLTSKFPYEVTDNIRDVMGRIMNADPVRPSALERDINDEVDSIVLKCLRKEPERRYQTAGELAREIRCYLSGEPIEAKRDSTLYVLGKKLRRHRWVVAVGLACVVGLSVFAVYAGVQAGHYNRLAHREQEARQFADVALEKATVAQREAVEQREAAVSESRRAQNITAFLVDMLGLANPDITQSPDMTMKEMLDRASAKVETELADQPETEATIRTVIGQAYASLGELDRAAQHLSRATQIRQHAVESTPEQIYETLRAYGNVLTDQVNTGWAWRASRAIILGKKIIGAEYPDLAMALTEAAWTETDIADPEVVVRLCDRIVQLARSTLPPDDPLWTYLGDQLYSIGARLQFWGHPEIAFPYLREALAIRRRFLPETHTDIGRALGKLAECYLASGRHVEAEALARESLELLARTLPDDHWYVAVNKARLGASLAGQGRFEQAERILLDANQRVVEVLGVTSARTIAVLTSLVELYDAWDKPEAAADYRDLLAAALAGPRGRVVNLAHMRPAFDARHTELLNALEEMSLAIENPNVDLKPLLDNVLDARRRLVPDGDPRAAVVGRVLLGSWRNRVRGSSQELRLPLYTEVIRLFRVSKSAHPLRLAKALIYQARILESRGEFERGEQAAREGLLLRQRHDTLPELIASAKSILGGCLMGQGRYAEAEQLITEGFKERLQFSGPTDFWTCEALDRLTTLYRQWGHMDRAYAHLMPLLRSALDRRNSSSALDSASWAIVKFPGFEHDAYAQALEAAEQAVALAPGDPTILNTLGVAQYRLGRYEQALTILEQSNELAGGMNCADLAFLAMAHLQLGHRQKARSLLIQLHPLVENRASQDDFDCVVFLREAQELIARASHRDARQTLTDSGCILPLPR